MFRCKWCQKMFEQKEQAEKHAIVCGIEFTLTPTTRG